jgi:CubicO group peptidase (beta-lactamase class C family)
MSHRSGLSCGVFDPGTTMFKAYNEQKVLNPATTLAQMIDALADPPLALHPGVSWEYSVATDVMARLIDDISGQGFDKFVQSRIFAPLGMVDTAFVVPENDRGRLTAYCARADLMEPMKPALSRTDDSEDMPAHSGGFRHRQMSRA